MNHFFLSFLFAGLAIIGILIVPVMLECIYIFVLWIYRVCRWFQMGMHRFALYYALATIKEIINKNRKKWTE